MVVDLVGESSIQHNMDSNGSIRHNCCYLDRTGTNNNICDCGKTSQMNLKSPTPIPSYFHSFRSLVDRSLRLTFDTQELTPEAQANIVERAHRQGHLIFLEQDENVNVEEIDLPELKKNPGEKKTPGQRLRNVLYHVWESTGENGDSEDFYRNEMERIINHYKSKLT